MSTCLAGGVTNSDLAMQIQADIGGFRVCRPHMRE
jgi:glycerol kinase